MLSGFLDEYTGKIHYFILELPHLVPNAAHSTLMLHIMYFIMNLYC